MTRRAPASLPCPLCGSEETALVTLRGRPVRAGGAVIRGHRCATCQHEYVSVQRVASPDDMADAVLRYDERVA